MSKFEKESEAGRIVATVGAVEVSRCMCGKSTCRRCGGPLNAHPGPDNAHHCQSCGLPIRCALNER